MKEELINKAYEIAKERYADSGYGSEENHEYLEMEEMMGYVKYNWFQDRKSVV